MYEEIHSCNLMNKRSVKKEKPCEWLETVCCILDQFSITWLRKAIPLAEEIDKLKSEKISDQSIIIDLQNKAIEKSNKQLKSMQNTVQTEMKSYSSVVRKSINAAFAPKKIHAAVKKVENQIE